MKVVKVMVHIEAPCPKCGQPFAQTGLAAVTDDGRIGEPTYYPEGGRNCNACQKQERDAENAAYSEQKAKRMAQRRWAIAASARAKGEV